MSFRSRDQARLTFRRRGLQLKQERAVDLLDIDAAILDRLESIGDLDDLAGGEVWISEGEWGRTSFGLPATLVFD
jgi:hypothetical protein